MPLRINKRIGADTLDDLNAQIKTMSQDGWRAGRPIHIIGGIKPYRCHLWKDLPKGYKESIEERQRELYPDRYEQEVN